MRRMWTSASGVVLANTVTFAAVMVIGHITRNDLRPMAAFASIISGWIGWRIGEAIETIITGRRS